MIRYRRLNEKHSLSRHNFLRENLESVVSDYFVREVEVDSQQEDRIRKSLKPFLTVAQDMVSAFVADLREYPEVSDIKVSDWKAKNIDRYVCKVSYRVPSDYIYQGKKIADDICTKHGFGRGDHRLWRFCYDIFSTKTMTVGDIYMEYDVDHNEMTFMVRLNMDEVDKLA